MDVAGFVRKWRSVELREKQASQEHFLDLCRLVGAKTPADEDPKGERYCFERGAKKAGAGDGWADVWRKGHFAWEYKGPGKDLERAHQQLLQYSAALDNPPLLVVSDMDTIIIRTNFTNTVQQLHTITLDTLSEPENLEKLRWLFTEPERFRPGITTSFITEAAAGRFADIARRLRARGNAPPAVAHFLNKILFCLFAEDAGLLPNKLFTRMMEGSLQYPERAQGMVRDLFRAMQGGGTFGADVIEWFNGGLFDGEEALPLEEQDLRDILEVAKLDWSAIEPSIFGTLFERGLDPDKRSQLGAHYTDPGSIMRIVTPVVVEPLEAEWAEVLARIRAAMGEGKERSRKEAADRYHAFLRRLEGFHVLDPACGSGNFLYLALHALKDFEQKVHLEAEQAGLQRALSLSVGVQSVMGIEINPYAAELARVTVWIGEIQWRLRHGNQPPKDPILGNLNQIECRDAVVNPDGTESEWPAADCIIGNPPFLGDKKMLRQMGEEYVGKLRACFKGRVPGGADLVTYWFEKGRSQIEGGRAKFAGLVATNSIRGGKNRKVLDRIRDTGEIFSAWGDEDWVNEGAAVRVSMVCFGPIGQARPIRLEGKQVGAIFSDLSGRAAIGDPSFDLTKAKGLAENGGLSFMGITKSGPFDILGDVARQWLNLPNPHGKSNSEVLAPLVNGFDLTRRSSDTWIINFRDFSEAQAALYEAPFLYALETIKPERELSRTTKNREVWWRFERARPEMYETFKKSSRFIATPRVSKHRVFSWLNSTVLPDCQLIAIARDDDVSFGVLHSRIHEVWALKQCSWLGIGNDPRYTPTTTFETFPFPEGLTPNLPADSYVSDSRAVRIAEAAKRLNELREAWLNPPEWVERVPEVVPGYPDRILPKAGHEAELKKRTLTNLYNARPAWLDHAHKELDLAVAAAYGWTDYTPEMCEDEILRRLLALNFQRSGRLSLEKMELPIAAEPEGEYGRKRRSPKAKVKP